MTAWIARHMRTFAGTLARLAHAPVASLLNIGVIGIALALPVSFYVGLVNLQAVAQDLATDPQLSMFLTLDAGNSDVARIERMLTEHPRVRKFRHVTRDAALASLSAKAELGDIIGSLGRNPLPDAFVIDAADSSPDVLERLRDEFSTWPRVEHVQLDSAWANRLAAAIHLGRIAVLLLATLLALALVAITFNTIRLQVLTQRQEIEVSKLIGATDPFIRRPFLYHGAVLGLTGGLAAWAIVWIVTLLLNQGLSQLSELYGVDLRLQHLGGADSLSLLAFAAGLGWLGAWLSVGRHLAEIDAR